MNTTMKWYCPVCGYALTDHDDRSSTTTTVYDTAYVFDTKICPSCGIQFGMGDIGGIANYEHNKKYYTNLRQKWIQGGMKWGWSFKHQKAFDSDSAPQNWNPNDQLRNIPKEFLSEGERY